jgi:hypothetical protein
VLFAYERSNQLNERPEPTYTPACCMGLHLWRTARKSPGMADIGTYDFDNILTFAGKTQNISISRMQKRDHLPPLASG